MSESLLRKRVLPIAAVGAAILTMAGCRACGFADDQSFVFGCPPETPQPQVAQPRYTDVPDSFKNKLKIAVSCTDPSSGRTVAPLKISAGSDELTSTVPGETQYKFRVDYSVDSTQPPVTVESIDFDDSAQPDAGVITMRGMYRFDEMVGPTALVASK